MSTNIEKLTENITQEHKIEIKNSLNRLFLLIKESFIQSSRYPQYNIMKSLINMKITKIEYEKMLYKPKIRFGVFIFNDHLGRASLPHSQFFRTTDCLTKLKKNKIALYLDNKLQIYSENFQYLEFEEEIAPFYFILPYKDNLLFLFGFGKIYQYTFTSKKIRKLYIKGKPSNDCFLKGIPLSSDIIIVMGRNGLYKWNITKKTFNSLVKFPKDDDDKQLQLLKQVKDNLFLFFYDEKIIFYDIEKKKIIKNIIYSKTSDEKLLIKDCLLLGDLIILSVKTPGINHYEGKILIFSLQDHHLIHTFNFLFSEFIGNLIPYGNTSFIGIGLPNLKIYVIETEPCQIVTIYNNILTQIDSYFFESEEDLLKYNNNQYFFVIGGRVICLIDPFDSNIKINPCQAKQNKRK